MFKLVPTENQNQIVIDFCKDARCGSLAGLKDHRAPFIEMYQIERNRESFAHDAPFEFRLDSTMRDVTQRAVPSPSELPDRIAHLSNQPGVSFVDAHQSPKIAHGPHCGRSEDRNWCARIRRTGQAHS